MRREGRQHGMIRTYPILSSPWNPRPKPSNLNELSSLPTAGFFHKVSTKPTNHSKFTGKCGRAIHQACKSKDKVKGTHKIRSLSQSALITCWVVDTNKVTGMLDDLVGDDMMNHDYEDGYVNDHDVEEIYDNEVSFEIKEIDDSEVNGVVDNADQMSFYEVGLAWQWQLVDEDEEDWCMVEEM